jgi:hypothetical protein
VDGDSTIWRPIENPGAVRRFAESDDDGSEYGTKHRMETGRALGGTKAGANGTDNIQRPQRDLGDVELANCCQTAGTLLETASAPKDNAQL